MRLWDKQKVVVVVLVEGVVEVVKVVLVQGQTRPPSREEQGEQGGHRYIQKTGLKEEEGEEQGCVPLELSPAQP